MTAHMENFKALGARVESWRAECIKKPLKLVPLEAILRIACARHARAAMTPLFEFANNVINDHRIQLCRQNEQRAARASKSTASAGGTPARKSPSVKHGSFNGCHCTGVLG